MKTLVIEKENLKHNINTIKNYAQKLKQEKSPQIIAVVKSNGYGMDLIQYTKFLIDNGIDFLAVSTIEEALKLRQAGIKEKILMLSSTAIKEDLESLINNDIILTIGSEESLKIVNEIGKQLNKKINVHLKIDTGFGRYGFLYNELDRFIEIVKNTENIKIEGTFTHFSIAYFDDEYTKLQYKRFNECIEKLKENKIETGILHVCNSSAFVKFPNMYLDAVRLGSIFTGRLAFSNTLGLKKVGYFKSNVSEIKKLPAGYNIGYSNTYKTKQETTVAIIPVGYIDGINITTDRDMFRTIDKLRYIVRDVKDAFKSQSKSVKINNQKCKILGRIGTHHVIADITNKNIKIGDETIFEINPKYVDSSIRREYK